MDLIIKRLEAHFHYLLPRIDDEKKRKQFISAMNALVTDELDFFNEYRNKNDGSKMALDIYLEILQIHMIRFEEGRSGDAYMEKL